jgi:N-acetylglucosamine-6-phosphate deacetylase
MEQSGIGQADDARRPLRPPPANNAGLRPADNAGLRPADNAGLCNSRGSWALINGRVVLPDAVVKGQVLLIEGDRIAGLVDSASVGSSIPRVDAGGRFITPGLIDIHTHGALGHTFNEPTAEAFAAITAENARQGVTSLLATLATAPIEDLIRCLEFAAQWMSEPRAGAHVMGVHLEGPYFSSAQKGAQDPGNLRTPNDGTPDLLLPWHKILRVVTFAPELPGALDLAQMVAQLGLVPAAGHSAATDADVRAAMEAGLRHVVHLWSGQSSTIRQGPWRVPGLLEASLTFEGLTAEIIADNRHLPPTLMKLAFKCLGPDRLCAVSDASSGAGFPEGVRYRMGEMEYEVHDGVGMLLDCSAFAGSTTLLNRMVPVLRDVASIPLAEAVRMVTLTPARIIGVDRRKGSIEAGKDADIAVFEDDFTAWGVVIGGRWYR